MKGTEDLIWMIAFACVVLLVASVLIIFFSKPVSGIMDEATRLQAKYHSYQIAGIISLSQSSDNGIITELELPVTRAEILINKLYVSVDFGPKNQYTHYFSESSPMKTKIKLIDYITDPTNPVSVNEIRFDTAKHSTIIVHKINDELLIKTETR